ncbi:MAG: iron-containing alcohol dehydrogenase, partial [Desulfobacteraceae bacterium]|nr:iron-containing alcohol dehydrogenase [Desulfobacteraceae bacterium]
VDAKLTMSLPVYTTAVSGLDAFSQAVESYWSIHSTYQSKQFASDAIKLTMGNLPSAVNNPTAEARLKMAKAAHLAGKAINITRTTAAHSISYPLTSHFGVSHGQAVGITLSSLLVFNADVSDEDVLDKRGADYVRQTIDQICKLLDSSNPSDAKKRIDLLVNQIGLQTKLSKLGLKDKQDVELIISNGFDPNRVKNNPRELTERALRDILQQIY